MPLTEEPKAERLRQKAEELRVIAESMSHQGARSGLLMLARNYETLASRMDGLSVRLRRASQAISEADFSPFDRRLAPLGERIANYREKAAELRRLAEGLQDRTARATMLALAGDYEAIVAKLEAEEASTRVAPGAAGPEGPDARKRAS
jgi:hypothetical protein